MQVISKSSNCIKKTIRPNEKLKRLINKKFKQYTYSELYRCIKELSQNFPYIFMGVRKIFFLLGFGVPVSWELSSPVGSPLFLTALKYNTNLSA